MAIATSVATVAACSTTWLGPITAIATPVVPVPWSIVSRADRTSVWRFARAATVRALVTSPIARSEWWTIATTTTSTATATDEAIVSEIAEPTTAEMTPRVIESIAPEWTAHSIATVATTTTTTAIETTIVATSFEAARSRAASGITARTRPTERTRPRSTKATPEATRSRSATVAARS
uniref:Putative dynactin-associated protein isoform x2 n=1 Tax=Anopheles darlingi TaxID=43151 RepID=A0A2M4D788_ANODA